MYSFKENERLRREGEKERGEAGIAYAYQDTLLSVALQRIFWTRARAGLFRYVREMTPRDVRSER